MQFKNVPIEAHLFKHTGPSQLKSMATVRKISPFRLSSLLRLEKNPNLALQLFENPNPDPTTASSPQRKPFRYSARSYDLIICKLGRAKMFREMELVLDQMKLEARFFPKEALFCQVISSYGRARLPDHAFRTFLKIPSFRCRRTIWSFNSLLNALLKCRDFGRIEELCRDFGTSLFTPDAYTYNILMNACCAVGSLENAWKLFVEMPRTGVRPNVATFGTLVSALCANSKLDEAFKLKEEMWQVNNVRPNCFIYTSLIKGLCSKGELDLAMKLKEEVLLKRVPGLDSAIYTTLIRALFDAGRKGEVVALLEEMRENGVEPDTVTYNAMIAGFCGEKEFEAAFEVLNEMVRKGCKPDVVSYNVIIAGFCKVGKWQQATDLFEDMPRRGCSPDVLSYRILIDGLCDRMQFKDAAFLMDEMVFKGHIPNPACVVKIVEGLDMGGDLDLLMSILNNLIKSSGIDFNLWNVASGIVCKESEIVKACELVDILRTAG